nr:hypothetical protein [Tanacetum cinerariifolium]
MEQENEELKKHLQIVLDDDDDVYTDATPLASEISIIDYMIHTERNRPYFKIIRADGNHRLFLSFITMLKNFDREDLRSLWNTVRERFAKTEPKNYSNEFLGSGNLFLLLIDLKWYKGTRANTLGTGGNYLGQQMIVKCFNCQEEGHMARPCPKPKRKRDAARFREKVRLVEAQGNGKVLTREELEFLADPSIVEGLVTQSVITHNAAYQLNDLDAYDYDCDEIYTAKAVLMANYSSYGSDVLSEVPISDNTHNDMLNQSVQEMLYYEPSDFVKHSENEIHNDSNIIPYS